MEMYSLIVQLSAHYIQSVAFGDLERRLHLDDFVFLQKKNASAWGCRVPFLLPPLALLSNSTETAILISNRAFLACMLLSCFAC